MRDLMNFEIEACGGGMQDASHDKLTICTPGGIVWGTWSAWVGAYESVVDFTSRNIVEPLLS